MSQSKKNDKPPATTSRQQLSAQSAPVSSLLPPIPNNPAPPNNLQAQLLAFIGRQGAAVGQGFRNAVPPKEAAVANLLAAAASTGSLGGGIASLPLQNSAPPPTLTPSNIQDWTLDKLEKHVQLLVQLQQPVPQNISMMLAEAKRREEKKQAKRLANRKSASTSRARKKALVQEMTELNARLKRQALILSLLPDLVIVMSVDGVVTFCSAQVERVLKHKIDDLVGTKLVNILVPSSRNRLQNLVKEVRGGNKETTTGASSQSERVRNKMVKRREGVGDLKGVSNDEAADVSSGDAPAVVSEPSTFPLSVVKVAKKSNVVGNSLADGSDENENSDGSGGQVDSKRSSSMTNSNSLPRSPTASSIGNSGSDDGARKNIRDGEKKMGSNGSSCDTSNSSSLSNDAKKVQNANDNLIRNVRWHNRKIKDKKKNGTFKDDVTGDDVTANNATARLSSLRHRMDPSSEEDSGYRESNDSREETSSSTSDLSDTNGRRKPMAPTCNLCLVREDLTTVWCEVTSSIQTRVLESENDDEGKAKKGPVSSNDADNQADIKSDSSSPKESITEILLCIRPIRDGERHEEKKPRRQKVSSSGDGAKAVSDSTVGEGTSNGTSNSSLPHSSGPMRPPKKRHWEGSAFEDDNSKRTKEGSSDVPTDAVKSLMAMSTKRN